MDSDKDKTPSDDLAKGEQEQAPLTEVSDEVEPSTEEEEEVQPIVQAPVQPKAKGAYALGTFALILAIVAVAGSAYLWYRFEVQQKHEQEVASANLLGELKAITESTRALEKQQDRLASDQDQLNTLIQEKLEASVATLREQQDALTNSVTKIYDSLDRSIDSWALEEVEQLLRMANHRVSLEGDAANALIALELADKRLAELGNPEFLEVRRLIAEEIALLNATEQVDLPGLALRLSTLVANVSELPLVSEPVRPVAAEDGEPTAASSDNAWVEAGQALLADLKGLVRIQNVTEAAQPLLTPEQRYFLIANLRLMLSGAQMAVLRSDNQTFKANLGQATQWLSEYFDTEDQAVKAMLTELEEISSQNLTPERPKITGSIVELQGIKSRMKTQ
ncbi:MAG: uroporphyrinogen-III C-methyltransferase [Arenicellales bacterium]|nr:uroporphyrinogen-III C-methyltransferase [Arenicellales bacterium]